MLAIALLSACAPLPMHAAAIVVDRSDSIEEGDGSSCAAVDGIVAAELSRGDVDVRSTLAVWATGDRDTALAPVRIAAPVPVPVAGSLIESDRVVARARQAARDEIGAACRSAVTLARRSPIVNAVDAAARSLHDSGCGDADACTLWVISDLQETEYAPLVSLIRPGGEPSAPLTTIDATGLEVRACGYASTRGTLEGALTPELRDRTEAAWARILVGARRFRLEPGCPAAR